MTYRFDGFELNEITRELQQDGRAVPIEPKVFDLLVLTLRNRTRVLPRDFLLRELWPGTSVSEASLSRLVKEARWALSDTGERQALIRTVRGVGYRFVGDVEQSPNLGSWVEVETRIAHARQTLETAVDRGARDLRGHIDDFVRTGQIAMQSAHESNGN